MEEIKKIYIKIFILIVIFFLCLIIYLNKTNNTCDKCIIQFSSKPLYLDQIKVENVSIIDIYEDYIQDQCKVIKTNDGFIING